MNVIQKILMVILYIINRPQMNEQSLVPPTPGIHVDPIPQQYITALALFTLWES